MTLSEEEIKAIQEENAKLKADLEAATKPDPKPEHKPEHKPEPNAETQGDKDQNLTDKARRQKEEEAQRGNETQRIESSIQFNMGLKDFVEQHKDILPAEIEDILKVAEKEKYDSAIERASAIRSAMVQSFFEVQSNLDLLTNKQKTQIEDWLKLTKNGRENKADTIFENIFEPSLEMIKRVKKAEELSKARSGFSSGTQVENDYKNRLMEVSKNTYLGGKK